MDVQLTDVEARILGCLMEKSIATPEYYPLSLNALINACNQKSSRDPVVSFDEATVQAGLDGLCEKDIVFKSKLSRVPKYEEHFTQSRQLVPKEIALLCVLLLRGPQTVGELRSRTTRMYTFDDLEEVMTTIDNLSDYGLISQLPRLPGHKESRYQQLLCKTDEDTDQISTTMDEEELSDIIRRLEKMEDAFEMIRSDIDDLKHAFNEFKQQFE